MNTSGRSNPPQSGRELGTLEDLNRPRGNLRDNTGTLAVQGGMGLTASFSISAFLYWRRSLRIPFGRKEYIPCRRERQSLTPGLNAGARAHQGSKRTAELYSC